MQPRYLLQGNIHSVTPVRRSDPIVLDIDGRRFDARLLQHDGHSGEIMLNGVATPFYCAQDGNSLFVHLGGRTWQLDALDDFGEAVDSAQSARTVTAPMPGVVVEIHVATGDSVTAGQVIMMIESMKLQTEIKAGSDGVVVELGVGPLENFEKGALLVEIEPAESP